MIEQQLELNAKIASFTNGVKPVSTEAATNNKTKASINGLLHLDSSSDDDSTFVLDSSSPSKKRKVSNKK